MNSIAEIFDNSKQLLDGINGFINTGDMEKSFHTARGGLIMDVGYFDK